MIFYDWLESPLGRLLLVADGEALTAVYLNTELLGPAPLWQRAEALPPLASAREQLAEYFRGIRKGFDLPLRLSGTPFQRRVWEELAGIPYGAVISYGELARRVGNPKAARAAGAATGANPIPIVIPCHRVIGADGGLTGFGGGLERKRSLLELEAAVLRAAGS